MSVVEQPRETVVPVTRRDVLHRAADLLEEFGWCQGPKGMPNHWEHQEAYCFLGSIAQAIRDYGGDPDKHFLSAYGAAGEVFMGHAVDASMTHRLWLWNDHTATYEEVVARLREAAEEAA